MEETTDGFVEQAELLAESVADTMHECVLVLDAALRVRLANRSFYRTFGVSPDETVGRLVFEIGDGQWDTDEFRRLLEHVLPANSEFDGFEVTNDFSRIGRRTMVLNGRRLHRREKREALIFLAIDDITDRKCEWEAITRSHTELSQFAHSVAHDLRSPLRTLSSYTELLLRRIPSELKTDENTCAYIQFIRMGLSNMEELISSLLSYATATQAEPQRKSGVQVQDVLDAAIANLRDAIEAIPAQVTSDPLPEVKGYQMQLVQVFQNLLSNAIKYRRAEEPLRIHVGVRDAGSDWQFFVEDNGVGIPPEYHERIFVPLYRLHGPATPGSGIGLATCRRVIENHGGRIWVESEVGRGSTFFFTMPKQTE